MSNTPHSLRILRTGVTAVALSLVAVLAVPVAAAAAPAIIPMADTTSLTMVPPEPAPPVIVPVAVATPDPEPAPTVAAPATTAPPVATEQAPARATVAPARIGEADRVEAPAPAPTDSTTSLRIEVPASDHASRTVTLRDRDGAVVAGPYAAAGDDISIEDLRPGSYDLWLEDATEAGGSTVARTPVTLSASTAHVARCDDALDCTLD